jgi:hypothetical protein
MFKKSFLNIQTKRKDNMVDQIQGMSAMMGAGRQHFKSEPLTEDQKTQMQKILAQYDSANVSTEDAKAIFQAFKDAGIKPARGMKEVIEAAGFDAEDLRTKGMPDGGPNQGTRHVTSSKIDLSALKSLQDILSQFDLTNLSDKDSNSLSSKLQELGFMNSGSVIDLKS